MDKESFKHHISPVPPEKETRFTRFFQKVNSLFKKESAYEFKLVGRIHELHADAELTLAALTRLRQKLETVIEPRLFSFMVTIIELNTKEISRIRKVPGEGKNTSDHVKTIQNCLEWIDNAKDIILLQNSECPPDLILKLVIQQFTREFHLCLDRDIQVLGDYAEHAAENLSLSQEDKTAFLFQLENEVQKQISNLNQMRKTRDDLELDSLADWRSEADRQREKCFSSALHEIDLVVAQFKPKKITEEPQDEHTQAIDIKLNELEIKVSSLNESCQSLNPSDDKKKKACEELLDALEQHIHELNSDLHLPQEHTHRVEKVINDLSSLRQAFFDVA